MSLDSKCMFYSKDSCVDCWNAVLKSYNCMRSELGYWYLCTLFEIFIVSFLTYFMQQSTFFMYRFVVC